MFFHHRQFSHWVLKKANDQKRLAFPAMSLLEIETRRPVGFFPDGSFLEVKEPFHLKSLASLLSQIVFEAGTFSIDSLTSMWHKDVPPFGISLFLWSLFPQLMRLFWPIDHEMKNVSVRVFCPTSLLSPQIGAVFRFCLFEQCLLCTTQGTV